MNGLTAGVDETSTLEKLYNKYYYFMYDHLPRWMKPTTTSNSNIGIAFTNGSSVLLQNSTGANVGQGAKWHWTHLTECASWDKNKVSDQIDNHLTNAISPSVKGMAFLESTSQGLNDWWHLSTELARKHQLPRWNYFFVPWYAIEEISIGYPPEGWQPKPDTLAHRDLVERTSPEFMDGQTYRLTAGQMYYWESTRYGFEIKGTLAEFYKNYPATPEESFVSSGRASFPLEVITWHDQNTREPWAYYDVLSPATPSERVITEPVRRTDGTIAHPPRIQKFGSVEVGPVWTTEDERRHPLGLIRIWEPPDEARKHDTYCSVDTADGIANWSRHTYKPDDDYPDRAAVEMFRQSRTRDGEVVDVQIGEFFAPISPLQTSPYVVALGMLMHGRNAIEQQPPVMIELTGGGKTLQEDLINKFGWFHFYQDFRFNGQEWIEVDKFGWTSTGTSVRQLWTKGKQKLVDIASACPKCQTRTVDQVSPTDKRVNCPRCRFPEPVDPIRVGRVVLRSKPLVNEMRICEDDAVYMSILSRFARGKAKEGSKQHDDLVYASMFDLWQANLFNQTPGGTTTSPVHMTVAAQPGVPFSARDMTPEERRDFWAEWDNRVASQWANIVF